MRGIGGRLLSGLPSLRLASSSYCWEVFLRPLHITGTKRTLQRCHFPYLFSTAPSITSLCTCTPHNNIDTKKTPHKKKVGAKPGNKEKRTMPLPCGRETFVQSSKFVRLSHSRPTLAQLAAKREASPQETTAALARRGTATVLCPQAGNGQRGRRAAAPHPCAPVGTDPRASSGEAGYTTQKGAGQNLSQTMLRHLTVGLTVGSVVILHYQTQPCIAGRASPIPHATTAVHTALLFKLSSHTATLAEEGTRGRRFEGKPLFPAAAPSQHCPLPLHSRMPFWSC